MGFLKFWICHIDDIGVDQASTAEGPCDVISLSSIVDCVAESSKECTVSINGTAGSQIEPVDVKAITDTNASSRAHHSSQTIPFPGLPNRQHSSSDVKTPPASSKRAKKKSSWTTPAPTSGKENVAKNKRTSAVKQGAGSKEDRLVACTNRFGFLPTEEFSPTDDVERPQEDQLPLTGTKFSGKIDDSRELNLSAVETVCIDDNAVKVQDDGPTSFCDSSPVPSVKSADDLASSSEPQRQSPGAVSRPLDSPPGYQTNVKGDRSKTKLSKAAKKKKSRSKTR
jgi:hypothetical protein